MLDTQGRKAKVMLIITLLIFLTVFGSTGQWWAGLICWGHFVCFLMPRSWLQ